MHDRRVVIAVAIALSCSTLPADVRVENGTFVVGLPPSDSVEARPFNLSGHSVKFSPAGANAYDVSTVADAFDGSVGDVIPLEANDVGLVDLGFPFPFAGRVVQQMYVARWGTLSPDVPSPFPTPLLHPVELAARGPLIAALVRTRPSLEATSSQTPYLRRDANGVTITWLYEHSLESADAQVRLSRDGMIVLSYRNVRDITQFGAGVIADVRAGLTPLDSASDSANDVAPDVAIKRDALDIRSVRISRIGETRLLEVRMRLGAIPAVDGLAADQYLLAGFEVGADAHGAAVALYGDGSRLVFVELFDWIESSATLRIEGDELVWIADQRLLEAHAGDTWRFFTRLGSRTGSAPADELRHPVPLDDVAGLQTDFASLSQPARLSRVAYEIFAQPDVDLNVVWEQVRAAVPALNDDNVDAVAIYETFVPFQRSISSGVGNPGADGVQSGRSSYGSGFAPRPALLSMDMIERTPILQDAVRTLMHEFGHHWLYRVRIQEGAQVTGMLSPDGSGHPAQYVDTRSAFPVYGPGETSVMGGGRFEETGPSQFTAGPYLPYGLSWHELYLMGLAAPEEVPDWFYVAHSAPPLAGSGFPIAGRTYSGTRTSVSIQQLIAGNGPRKPAHPHTRTTFRVVFVLVTQPGDETAASLAGIDAVRAEFVRVFHLATGGRGAVVTSVPAPPQRRRAVGR